MLPGPEELEARLAGHAVAQGVHAMSGDADLRHVEEFQLRRLLAEHLLHDLHRVRSLDLEAVRAANHRARPRDRALVTLAGNIVTAGLRVELHPVVHRRTADQVEAVAAQVRQHDVADHVAVVVTGDELLRLVGLEALEAVDAQVGEELQSVRTFHIHVGHVIGLVEEHTGFLPGALFIPPVGVLGRNDRINIGAGLRVAQQLDRVADAVDQVFQGLRGHFHLQEGREGILATWIPTGQYGIPFICFVSTRRLYRSAKLV